MSSTVQPTGRTWKKPSFIANPVVRWGLLLAVAAYVWWP